MDDLNCCLLLLCCDLAGRKRKVLAHFKAFSVSGEAAQKLADDAIQRADALLATGLGDLLKSAANGKRAKDE